MHNEPFQIISQKTVVGCPWMVLFTLLEKSLYDLRVMPCSRAPDTMCKNVLLGYSKSGRPRWWLWLGHRPVFSSDKCVERYLSNREWPQFRDVDTFHTILDKIDGKFVPHPPPPLPNQGWENSAFWLLRGFIPDLGGWGFADPFYSVKDCSYGPDSKRNSRHKIDDH